MHVNVIASINEARSDDFMNKTTIVIDVLRATSSIITAVGAGCAGVIPAETVSAAKQLQQQGELLGGERYSKKIPSFQFGNSPAEYDTPEIRGKKIIMTTSNGTRAIHKAQKSTHLLVGAFLNAASCAKVAHKLQRDITIVCAGTQDLFALEDGLCAGMIIEELLAREISREISQEASRELPREASPPAGSSLLINDFGLAMLYAYRQQCGILEETLLACESGIRLTRLGYKTDVLLCARINVYEVVPVLRGQILQC